MKRKCVIANILHLDFLIPLFNSTFHTRFKIPFDRNVVGYSLVLGPLPEFHAQVLLGVAVTCRLGQLCHHCMLSRGQAGHPWHVTRTGRRVSELRILDGPLVVLEGSLHGLSGAAR